MSTVLTTNVFVASAVLILKVIAGLQWYTIVILTQHHVIFSFSLLRVLGSVTQLLAYTAIINLELNDLVDN